MDVKEKELIAQILAGDRSAFEPLVRPYRQPLFGLAYRMTGNREDALEVAQDALLRAYRYLGRCDLDRSFRNWLYQILVNAARDFVSKKGREADWRSPEPLPETTAAATAGPEAIQARNEIRSKIMSALSVLNGREREVFLLRDLEEKSIQETAEITRSSSIAIRVHLSRARRKVRDYLTAMDPSLAEVDR